MAIQSALTGHLVFSTLHTNDAASAITRLLDLGIEPYLIASSLIGVLAQRLVRQVCPRCARPLEPSTDDLRRLGLNAPPPVSAGPVMRAAVGCDDCRQTGYSGRLGIFELLLLDDAIRARVQDRSTSADLKSTAAACGMRTLRDDGIAKAFAGKTTIEEVLRVTMRSGE